jgi:hypothetical protein
MLFEYTFVGLLFRVCWQLLCSQEIQDKERLFGQRGCPALSTFVANEHTKSYCPFSLSVSMRLLDMHRLPVRHWTTKSQNPKPQVKKIDNPLTKRRDYIGC